MLHIMLQKSGILAQELLLLVCRCLVIGLMQEQKEECLSSTDCEALRTDMFVSCKQLRECMMTSFIFPTTQPHTTSCNSKSFCFFKCDSKKENPLALCSTRPPELEFI